VAGFGVGLPDLKRDGLRRAGATWLADSGVPSHVLQQILGHEAIETTRGHIHPDHRHLVGDTQLVAQDARGRVGVDRVGVVVSVFVGHARS
jgi:integrase